MNDDTLADLKQFITAGIYQQTTDLKTEIEGLLDKKIDKLDKKLSEKIDDLSGSVAEAISSNNDSVDSKLKDHEARITQLENLPV